MTFSDSTRDVRFSTTFNLPLKLGAKKMYKLALVNLETYYTFPSIDTERNLFRWFDGTDWCNFEIPISSYGVSLLNKTIKDEIENKNRNSNSITVRQ